jgi:hypothetical protein
MIDRARRIGSLFMSSPIALMPSLSAAHIGRHAREAAMKCGLTSANVGNRTRRGGVLPSLS